MNAAIQPRTSSSIADQARSTGMLRREPSTSIHIQWLLEAAGRSRSQLQQTCSVPRLLRATSEELRDEISATRIVVARLKSRPELSPTHTSASIYHCREEFLVRRKPVGAAQRRDKIQGRGLCELTGTIQKVSFWILQPYHSSAAGNNSTAPHAFSLSRSSGRRISDPFSSVRWNFSNILILLITRTKI